MFVAKKRKEEKPREFTRRQLSHARKEERRHRIILLTGIIIIAAAVLLPLAGWIITDFYPMHRTMLEVNGKKYNVADYIDFMKALGTIQSTQYANDPYQLASAS